MGSKLADERRAEARGTERPSGGGLVPSHPSRSLPVRSPSRHAGYASRRKAREHDPEVDLSSGIDVGIAVPGSRFSFRYLGGERKLQRRTVTLKRWLASDLFEAYDEDVKERRWYYVSDTYDAEYHEVPWPKERSRKLKVA